MLLYRKKAKSNLRAWSLVIPNLTLSEIKQMCKDEYYTMLATSELIEEAREESK